MTSLMLRSHLLSDTATRSPDGADSGGVPPAPAASPAAPAAETSGGESLVQTDDVDLQDEGDFFLGSESVDDVDPVLPADKAPAKPAPVAEKSATPTTPPKKDELKEPPKPDAPVVPAKEEPAKSPAEAAPQVKAPVADESGKEPAKSLVQMIEESREKSIQTLSETRFKLTQEETEQYEAGDPAFIPKLVSRAFFESIRGAAELMEQAIPGMIANALAAQSLQKSADDEFYGGERSDLVPHREGIMKLAKTLRELNPDMPKAEFIPKLEEASRVLFGVQKTPAAAPASVVPAKNGRAAPHAPVVSSVPATFKPNQPKGGETDWGNISDLLDADT